MAQVVGPGAIQAAPTDIKPQLDGASEYEYVTIMNPLPVDFAVRIAQDVPVNMPVQIRNGTGLVQNDRDVTSAYGLSLKNPDFQSRKHIYNDTIIPAGQTINLKGSEAQVAVRQLTNEIMQRDGNSKLLSDPQLRAKVEATIIKSRGNIQDLMDNNIQTPRNQIDDAIARSNTPEQEQAFPSLQQSRPGTGENYTPKKLGRPPKNVD